MFDIVEVVSEFDVLLENLEQVWDVGKLAGKYKDLLKNVYDLTQAAGYSGSEALPQLIIKDFDNEQIWQEIELQNESYIPNLIPKAARLLVSRDVLNIPVKIDEGEVISEVKPTGKLNSLFDEPKAVSSDEEEDVSDDGEDKDEQDIDMDDSLSEDEEDEDEIRVNKNVKIVPSQVDDEFFKLSEMENFLNGEENERDKRNRINYDFFNASESDSDGDEEMRPKYDDFFGGVQNEYDEVGESSRVSDTEFDNNYSTRDDVESHNDEFANDKKVRFSGLPAEMDSGDDVKEENDSNLSSNDEAEKPKSSFEMRQMKLRKRIDALESQALDEKPWQLKGEVTAEVRPVNSLLEEFVEFDVTQRPAPVVTVETTNKLEDIIKIRIRDKAFDDVERKIKPVYTPHELKKKLVLDQEKSKLSLAEIYEKEYLKQKEEISGDKDDKPEVEAEEHTEIRKKMDSLFKKLDALSDFYFVPKPANPELKIVSSMPAVNLEEVAPTSISDANLLAPEEAAGTFKHTLVGKEERSKTDKKRERRKKKAFQKKKFKLEALKNPNKPATYAEELKKAVKFKNVSTLEERIGKTTKTSKEFFSKLQEETQKNIKSENNPGKKRKKIDSFNAKRLKL